MTVPKRLARRRTKDSHKRAADLATNTTAGAVPFLGPLVTYARALYEERNRQRIEAFCQYVLGNPATAADAARFEQAFTDEPFCLEAFTKILADEEAEKTWAYAALFRGFTNGSVPVDVRLTFLRVVRDLSNNELLALTRPEAIDTSRLTQLERTLPNLTATLARWGFARVEETWLSVPRQTRTGGIVNETRHGRAIAAPVAGSLHLLVHVLRQTLHTPT